MRRNENTKHMIMRVDINEPAPPRPPVSRLSICRYDPAGKLMGVEDIAGWTQDEINDLIEFINNRPDGSRASVKVVMDSMK